MLGLTTTRRFRTSQARLTESKAFAARACTDHVRERTALADRLDRALRACARYRAAAAPPQHVDHPDELWSLLDWSLWGSGIGDALREQIADATLAAITPEQHERALTLIATWHESGHHPVGRRAYEQQKARLHRAIRGAHRWRQEADAERRRTHLLAAQLLAPKADW